MPIGSGILIISSIDVINPSIDFSVNVSLFIKGLAKDFFSPFSKSILLASRILFLFLSKFLVSFVKARFF